MPSSANGTPGTQSDATTIHATSTPHDLAALSTPDEAANLAARPADTVIETLLAAAHIGLALLDRDMNYRLWNNCLEELFDVPADALLGRAVDAANGLIREFCAATPQCRFVDVNPALVDASGNPRAGFYRDDLLHYHPAAYVAFTDVIKPVVAAEWAQVTAGSRR